MEAERKGGEKSERKEKYEGNQKLRNGENVEEWIEK